MDLLIEAHIGFEHQGPGSSEMTLQTLSFISTLDADSRVLDLGCGIGGQTLVLVHDTNSDITGLDIIPDFIEVFNICWTDGYFTPREAANNTLLSKYPNDRTVKSYIATDEHEVELFSKYNQHYDYVFYIGQKL